MSTRSFPVANQADGYHLRSSLDLLNHTRYGRYIYALADNNLATRISGINVDRIKIGVYASAGC